MPQSHLFHEEGRARRGSKLGLLLFTAFWLLTSCAVAYAVFKYHTKPNLSPLQRVYFSDYRASALLSLNPFDTKSTYTLLTRDGINPKTGQLEPLACRDEEVIPVFGGDGQFQLDRKGMPVLRLKEFYFRQSKRFYWDLITASDKAMNKWLRGYFYEGRSLKKIFLPSVLSGVLVFASGMGGALSFERRRIKRYLRGRVIRGTRELTPKEYARELRKRADGVGLEVLAQEVR